MSLTNTHPTFSSCMSSDLRAVLEMPMPRGILSGYLTASLLPFSSEPWDHTHYISVGLKKTEQQCLCWWSNSRAPLITRTAHKAHGDNVGGICSRLWRWNFNLCNHWCRATGSDNTNLQTTCWNRSCKKLPHCKNSGFHPQSWMGFFVATSKTSNTLFTHISVIITSEDRTEEGKHVNAHGDLGSLEFRMFLHESAGLPLHKTLVLYSLRRHIAWIAECAHYRQARPCKRRQVSVITSY